MDFLIPNITHKALKSSVIALSTMSPQLCQDIDDEM